MDRWQSAKGLGVALVLLGVFLFTDWPRDVAALVGAGVLLLSQRFHSSKVMGKGLSTLRMPDALPHKSP